MYNFYNHLYLKYLNNDLESITTSRYPVVTDIKKALLKCGALGCQMTGSGPTVFGIYSNKEAQEIASNKLKNAVTDCQVFMAENI